MLHIVINRRTKPTTHDQLKTESDEKIILAMLFGYIENTR